MQRNKSTEERSENVKSYMTATNTLADGVIDSSSVVIKYKDVYYFIGVSEASVIP